MRRYSIAVIPGDGIGKEVTPAAMRVFQAAARRYGFALEETVYPWSCDYYKEHGRMMPEDGLEQLARHDAIFLGAIGNPAIVPDHIALRQSLLLWRQAFDLYINLRPVKVLPGIPGPLRERPGLKVDMVFVRENSEGEYAGIGGRLRPGTPDEVAVQTTVFTRLGVERVMRYAFELARRRPAKRLACATKSNAIQYTMVFWNEVCREVAKEYPDVEVTMYHIDALAARMVTHPETLDVVVTSNLFGDILTDLGGALQGSLGLPASGNIDPRRNKPSLFEPVHGSAPDIAGRGIANPMAAIWAGQMMLEFLGEEEAARGVMEALEAVAAEGRVRTPDIGGTSTTDEVAAAVAEKVAQSR
ncbi:MAG: tartrate dehydrogenase [Firmicutes bacterium]|nr:tartrate dehydrogenase [Bacillota bacterium]